MPKVRKDAGRVPGVKWAFDAGVADVFDDMLARSIPQHDVMRDAVTQVGMKFLKSETHIVDLGCSRGNALAPFVEANPGFDLHFFGLEMSEPMIAAARARFAGKTNVVIRKHDLRDGLPPFRASLILSVLTLQFVPINYRQGILSRCRESLVDGGALVLVEKVLGETSTIDRHMVEIYHALKSANGYSPDQIERKKLSLEGVLVPLTARFDEELLRSAGFSKVDCFWRWMNFAGWVAVK